MEPALGNAPRLQLYQSWVLLLYYAGVTINLLEPVVWNRTDSRSLTGREHHHHAARA